MINELKLYGQNVLLLIAVSALIGLIGWSVQPSAPRGGMSVSTYYPSSSR